MFCVRKTGHASFLVLVLNFIYGYPRNSLSTRKQFHKISPSLVSEHTLALCLRLRPRQNRELARSQGNPQPDQEATYSPGGGFSFNDVPTIDSFFMVPFVSSLKSHPWPRRTGFLLYFPGACGSVSRTGKCVVCPGSRFGRHVRLWYGLWFARGRPAVPAPAAEDVSSSPLCCLCSSVKDLASFTWVSFGPPFCSVDLSLLCLIHTVSIPAASSES